MNEMLEKIRAAGMAASEVNVAEENDDLTVFVKVRVYGFLVQVQDDAGRRTSRVVNWEIMEKAVGNPLLQAVTDAVAEIRK